MGFPLYIAKRYLFSKSSTNAVNIITSVSIFLIVIVTAVLVVVLSGFSGIKEFNISITSVIDPDLKVLPASGKTFVFDADQEIQLKAIPNLTKYSKVIEERAYLEFKGKTHLAYMKGVDNQYIKVNPIDTTIQWGKWPEVGEPEFAIGSGVARNLSIGIGDYRNLMTILVPKPGKGISTDPTQDFSSSSAVASGIFEAGEISQDHIFGNIDFVGKLLGYSADRISSLDIKIDDPGKEDQIRQELSKVFQQEMIIKNRTELNDALHKMLNTENLMLYFVCTLILIIALFSFVGSMIISILDKKRNIKTLSDLGASLQEIRMTFFLQGALIIIVGGAIGMAIGLIIAFLQQQFSLKMITATLPWPIKVEWMNMVIVYGLIILLGLTAARLAASRINQKMIDNL
ncbi:MAG: lipoprotein-releasing system permease protein [Flavobacteriales bacterium]